MAVLTAKKNQSVKPAFPNKSERDLRLFHDFREQRRTRASAQIYEVAP
jgi:hypothetical protein